MFHKIRPSGMAVIVLTLLGGAVPSRATTYYVNGTCGNNAWSGTSGTCSAPNGPKATIQDGLCLATQAGDTVVVAQGEYKGLGNRDLMFPKSGGGACPSSTGTARAITLRCEAGDDPELCVIDSEGGDANGNCNSSANNHRAFLILRG